MNSRQPQELVDAFTELNETFGEQVTYTRFLESTTPNRSVFGSDLQGTTTTLSTSVVIEDVKEDMLPTIAGMRPKEIVTMLAASGSFKMGDTVQYNGHNYIVSEIFPIQFRGQEVSEEVKMSREVD